MCWPASLRTLQNISPMADELFRFSWMIKHTPALVALCGPIR